MWGNFFFMKENFVKDILSYKKIINDMNGKTGCGEKFRTAYGIDQFFLNHME